MPASRSTISFTEQNWEKLEKEKNKSSIVNQALLFYFQTKERLKQREEEFILKELAHFEETQESYSFEDTFKE